MAILKEVIGGLPIIRNTIETLSVELFSGNLHIDITDDTILK